MPKKTNKPTKKSPAKEPYLDEEERALITSFEGGKPLSGARLAKELAFAHEAARNHLRKDARINVRMSKSDILMLKRRAARDGLPYQTLIASVLHRFATGQFEA